MSASASVAATAPGMSRRQAPARGPALVRRLLAMARRFESPQQPHAQADDPGSALAGGAPNPRALVDALYQQHATAVLAYLYHRLPSLADAEDALADVFLAALGACAAGGNTPTLAWLLTVGRRRVADFYRERQRHPAASGESLAWAADPRAGPESLALRADDLRELLALVAALPDEQREVLSLRFAAGLRSADIAAVIGKSDVATRALLSRALRRLRKEWTR